MSIFKVSIPVVKPIARHSTLTEIITLTIKWHELGTGVSIVTPKGIMYDSPVCNVPFTVCPCDSARWIRNSINKELYMAVVSPEDYAKAFNIKREEVRGLTDQELSARILELEQLIRELNLETRAAIVEKNERADKKREKIRLLDTEYKVQHRETTEVKARAATKSAPLSKEEKMIQKLIALGMSPEKAKKMAAGDDDE